VRVAILLCVTLLTFWSATALGQVAVTTRQTNLRRDPSSRNAPIQLLDANERLSLLSSRRRNGFYQVQTSDSTIGWVWARNVRIDTESSKPNILPPTTVAVGPGTPGSPTLNGCGDGLWQHVYHPARLLVINECVSVRGTIVDATNGRTVDGARHEADGDTHGWLKPDPEFANTLNQGNNSAEQGNLVFEIVCHYTVRQADAKPACSGFNDQTSIPPIGTHVEITGAFVQDNNHAKWNEIHPVSKIVILP
jgi:Bacterial SH3 domain